jgi:hypothetical protein
MGDCKKVKHLRCKKFCNASWCLQCFNSWCCNSIRKSSSCSCKMLNGVGFRVCVTVKLKAWQKYHFSLHLCVHILLLKVCLVRTVSYTGANARCWMVLGWGWSEPAATSAPVQDEAIQAILGMNQQHILPCPRFLVFSAFSLPKAFLSYQPPSYLPHLILRTFHCQSSGGPKREGKTSR